MTQEEKAKRYDELLLKLQKAKVDDNICDEMYYRVIDDIVPELKESEDEKIRKGIIRNLEYLLDRAEGFVKDELKERIAWLEKQGENHDDKYNITGIGSKHAQGKLGEMIKKIKSTDKVEPKFKVKYAGNEYNVLEVKDIDGVTFYGIEDEPNHIDYVQAENCERVDGYSIKENGSTYPTKPAVFSEQKPTWSEEDEGILRTIISDGIRGAEFDMLQIDWLKSIKNKYTWKPSDEQMKELNYAVNAMASSKFVRENDYCYNMLKSLQEQLKKLK